MGFWLRRQTPLILVMLLALGLRAVNLAYGLPSSFHPDEQTVVGSALRIAAQPGLDLDPGFYNYPALPIYVLAATYAVKGVVFPDARWPGRDAPDVPGAILLARWVTTLFGLATVLVVYLAGSLWISRGAGLWAALLLAIAPFHVLDSHYANVDVPMTFWATLALYFLLQFRRRGAQRWLMLAAMAVGCAGASKYTALVLVAVLPIACLLEGRSRVPLGKMVLSSLAAVGVALLTFSLCAPYTWIEFESFRTALGFESAHVATGHLGWDLNVGGWIYRPVLYQLLAGLPFLLGAALYLVSLGGFVADLRRPKVGSPLLWSAFLLSFAVVAWSRVVFPRYLLPCLPILVLMAARFLQERIARRDSGRAIGVAAAATGIGYTGALTLSLLVGLSPQNAQVASQWIQDNLDPGTEIGLAAVVASRSMPTDLYDVRPFDAERAAISGSGPEWLVVDSWYASAFARGNLRDGPTHRYFESLGEKGSDYEKVVAFETEYLTEGFYGTLDPYFMNQFESPDYSIYKRR